jgi:1-deoxy-D-xylulose-5-phosphate synthase
MADNDFKSDIKLLGIPDEFIEHGTVQQLYNEYGIDTEGIVKNTEQQALKPIKY